MKHNISKAQMVYEFVEMGKFDIVTYDKETRKRISTYASLDAHKAFSEALRRIERGSLFLVLQWPDNMLPHDRYKIESNYQTAIKYLAKIDFELLKRKY